MSDAIETKRLLFACECVSGQAGGYSDPWANVAKNKLLPDGTKEEIINLVAEQPRTISQLAEILGLRAPSIHAHVNDMIKSELLRDSEEWERRYPAERYYEPNFPIVGENDRAKFEKICQEISEQVVEIFERYLPEFESVFIETNLVQKGWEFADVSQYLFACVQRNARKMLEEQGSLQQAENHRNGIEWVFWAEEPKLDKMKP